MAMTTDFAHSAIPENAPARTLAAAFSSGHLVPLPHTASRNGPGIRGPLGVLKRRLHG